MNESRKDQLIADFKAEIAELKAGNAELQAENAELKAQLSDLAERCAELQRMVFGVSSEQSKAVGLAQKKNKQESKCRSEPSALSPSDEPSQTSSKPANDTAERKRKGGRRKLPAHLPRVRHVLPMDTTCKCGVELEIVGERVSEKLAIMPAFYYVIEHVHAKGVCPCCRDTIITAPAEPSLLPKSQATPEYLAHLMISKMLDGLPLYRQNQQALRVDCPIGRDKLARWLIAVGMALAPIVKLLEDAYNRYAVGGIDETHLTVIQEPGRTAKQKSYLFTRYGGSPEQQVMLVNYRPRKDYETIKGILEDFEGSHLVSDMAPGFIRFAKEHKGITLNACHDHSRRRFFEALMQIPKTHRKGSMPEQVIELYGAMYAIEQAAKDQPSHRILEARVESRALLDKIYALISIEDYRNTSLLGRACQYMQNHKAMLYSYLNYPQVPISNIMTEHIAKQIALARKNFLFCFSEAGAMALANIMSIVYSAHLHKHHNLNDYLTVVFLELPKADTLEELEALLPWHLSPNKVAEVIAARPRPFWIDAVKVA